MKNKLVFPVTCLAFCLGVVAPQIHTAQAQQAMGSLSYYPIPKAEIQKHYQEWALFMESEAREPCQNYQAPPAGYEMRGCHLYNSAESVAWLTPAAGSSGYSYTILFDLNKSGIRISEKSKLDKIAREIQAENPMEVTVSGYTDTSGTRKYNQALSERRTRAVVEALAARGVRVAADNQRSYGETGVAAVATADGVRMRKNRRVVIHFDR